MSKDLIDDRYGRFYEIAKELSKLGHDVIGITLSYRKRDEGILIDHQEKHYRIQWHSYNLTTCFMPRITRHLHKLQSTIKSFNADIIWACSDSLHAIIGYNLSKKTGIPCIADLYDNFESYGLTRIPGILPLFKRAIKNTEAITCVSHSLAEYINNNYTPNGYVAVIENAIPSGMFRPMGEKYCREHLSLPVDARYIGTAGALNHERGIDILFKGYEQLSSKYKNLHLLIAGPIGRNVKLPTGERVHYLNNLSYDKIPYLINSLDLAVVCNRDTDFGKYCFPQKIYEFMACQTPFIASAVDATQALLIKYPYCLYQVDDLADFILMATHQLKYPQQPEISIPTWRDQAIKLESILNATIIKHAI